MTREEKQKAIDALKISAPIMAVTQEEFKDYIQTLNQVMDWLEQDSTTKNDLGVDCISRADALDCVNWGYSFSDIYKKINELPSVTPQEPRKGHWIKGYTYPDGEYWKCDKCNELIKVKYPMHYCNNCGAKMESEAENGNDD